MVNDHKPTVSVIIPTYNRENSIERAIKSVLDQTYTDYELIVIDDGSTDDTSQVLRKYEKKIRSFSMLHSGVSAARNFGIGKAYGEWIALLDSDDYWMPEKLDKQMKWLEENPEFNVVQVGEKWIRNGKFVNPMKKHQKYSGWIFDKCLPLCIVSPSAVVMHKSVLDEAGLFDESMPVCEDYDLWLRIAKKHPIGLFDEMLIVKTGGHEDQLSRKYWGMDRYRVESMEKLLKEDLETWQRELVLKEIIAKLEVLYLGRTKRTDLPNIFEPKLRKYKRILHETNANYQLADSKM